MALDWIWRNALSCSPALSTWDVQWTKRAFTLCQAKLKPYRKHPPQHMWQSWSLSWDYSIIMASSWLICQRPCNHYISSCKGILLGSGVSSVKQLLMSARNSYQEVNCWCTLTWRNTWNWPRTLHRMEWAPLFPMKWKMAKKDPLPSHPEHWHPVRETILNFGIIFGVKKFHHYL